MIKKTNKLTHVCVPGSVLDEVMFSMKKDNIHDVKLYRGRHSKMNNVSEAERERTFIRILENCPSIRLERESLNDSDLKFKFMMILSVIIESDYDEEALTDYCINVLNDPERRKKYKEHIINTRAEREVN
ncbi:MAG: hypothetical protein K2J71_08280 [Oscillospiraceae bacterium]|nr:hypothetical protein [Oscillospiraceae bacterium]